MSTLRDFPAIRPPHVYSHMPTSDNPNVEFFLRKAPLLALADAIESWLWFESAPPDCETCGFALCRGEGTVCDDCWEETL